MQAIEVVFHCSRPRIFFPLFLVHKLIHAECEDKHKPTKYLNFLDTQMKWASSENCVLLGTTSKFSDWATGTVTVIIISVPLTYPLTP